MMVLCNLQFFGPLKNSILESKRSLSLRWHGHWQTIVPPYLNDIALFTEAPQNSEQNSQHHSIENFKLPQSGVTNDYIKLQTETLAIVQQTVEQAEKPSSCISEGKGGSIIVANKVNEEAMVSFQPG
ncbi:hypothetical protein Peur_057592 [Populus x canadensis]